MKYLPYIFVCLTFLACNDKDSSSGITLSNIRVLNDTSAALSARILFSVNRSADASISFYEGSSTEARHTPIHKGKLNHSITITGLKEKTSYRFVVNIPLADGSEYISEEHRFTTAAIPNSVKQFYKPEENPINEPDHSHFLFASRTGPACIYLLNSKGQMVWYRTTRNMLKVVRLTKNNSLLCLEDENNTSFGDGNVILELGLGGDTLFYARQGVKGFDRSVHHDLFLNSRGNIIAATNVFKTGNPIPGDGIMELDRNGNKIWEWTTFDSNDAAELGINNQPWINSLVEDTDGNYLISLRSFSQVWKINSVSGAVMWKLGKGGNVQMDVADEFMFQHYAHRNPAGDIMLFDNGSAARPVTRLMSFSIDEQQKKATRKLKVELPSDLYSAIMGSTMLMPDQHILSASATNGRIIKTNSTGTVLWSLKVAEPIYRAEYVGDPFLHY